MIIEAHYLPCIEYLGVISSYKEICLEVHENYQKQSYRNRCKILSTNQIDNLVIPVTKANVKEIVKNIRIDYSQDWVRRHLGALKAAYGKAPFFEHFYDYFSTIIERKPDFLIDLNYEILTVCLKLLKQNKKIVFSEYYQKYSEDDFRGKIHPKSELSALSFYDEYPYSQNFGQKFVPNLSIIDVFMCQGPLAAQIIESSKAKLNIFSPVGVLNE
ncbi:MAG: WbqC family protein [Bacteroidota bacterium]